MTDPSFGELLAERLPAPFSGWTSRSCAAALRLQPASTVSCSSPVQAGLPGAKS